VSRRGSNRRIKELVAATERAEARLQLRLTAAMLHPLLLVRLGPGAGGGAAPADHTPKGLAGGIGVPVELGNLRESCQRIP